MKRSKVTLEQMEQLAFQLPAPERLKLAARICEQLSTSVTEKEAKQLWQVRLQLAEELLAECDDIEDDSQGKFDTAEDIRRMRQERLREICQRGA